DGNITTLAPFAEIRTNLPTVVQEFLRLNPPPPPPFGAGRPSGPGAVPAPGSPTPTQTPPSTPAAEAAAGRPGGPGAGRGGVPAGPRPLRVELRIATDEAGEIYVLTKSDGRIRRIVNIR